MNEHIFARQERGTANSRCYFWARVPFSIIQLKHHIPFIEPTRALIREVATYKKKTLSSFFSFFFLTLRALLLFHTPSLLFPHHFPLFLLTKHTYTQHARSTTSGPNPLHHCPQRVQLEGCRGMNTKPTFPLSSLLSTAPSIILLLSSE